MPERSQKGILRLSRFSPTVNRWCHFGHLWTALVNDSLSEGGIILRIEDKTAGLAGSSSAALVEDVVRDFKEQLERFGVRVQQVIRQSEREDRYDEVWAKVSDVPLDWESPGWDAFLNHARPPLGFWGMDSYRGMLSRVVDDHDFGIRDVVMGSELAFRYGLYAFLWDRSFREEGVTARPTLHFIPEVMESQDQKISKHRCTSFFCRDWTHINPTRVMFEIAKRQMQGGPWDKMGGELADIRLEYHHPRGGVSSKVYRADLYDPEHYDINALRRFISIAEWPESWNIEPEPLTKEDLAQWN